MRTRIDIDSVLELGRSGLGASAIARATGVPRSTVRDWLDGRIPGATTQPVGEPDGVPAGAYSHLLGLYLGDGHVVRLGRTFMLRLFFDARYPGLIGAAVRTVREVAPRQRVAVFRRAPTNCVVLRCYWNRWPELLPQHGPGRKHDRPIALTPWQRRITHAHPRELVRGLLDSDGCRFANPVRHGDCLYLYTRYYFTNRSQDIKGIRCEHLDLLGIAWKPVGDRNVSIARREAVAALDAFVGPKA